MTGSTLPDELVGRRGMPYDGVDGPARAVLPPESSAPPMGQSPASPYTVGEPLVLRQAPPLVVVRPAPELVASPEPDPVPAPFVESEEPRPSRAFVEEPEIEDESVAVEPEIDALAEVAEPEAAEPEPAALSWPDPELPEPESEEPAAQEPAAETEHETYEPEPEPVAYRAVEAAPAEEPDVEDEAPEDAPMIPLISRTPDESTSQSLSAAQAYTAPHDPSMWFIGPMEESVAPPFVRVRHHGPERVGRGLLLAMVAVIVGWVVCAALFHFGHIPSIVALTIGPAGVLLYGKGAGSRPRAGAVKLVAMLVAAVILAWPISIATELYFYYVATTGTRDGVVGYVLSQVFSPSLFVAKLKEFLLVALFGLAGIIASVQTLIATRRRRPAQTPAESPAE